MLISYDNQNEVVFSPIKQSKSVTVCVKKNLFMKKLIIFFPFLMLSLLVFGQNRQVAITFDDLPATNASPVAMVEIIDKMVNTLHTEEIPAIGFVNEIKLYQKEKILPSRVDLLKKWLNAGLELGNHTYSHVFIDRTSIEEYKADVLKGERITRPLLKSYGKELKYFRHTQLRTGPTDVYRKALTNFLHQKNYTIAPVTIDNDEYIFAFVYMKAKEKNDEKTMAWIGEEYIRYMSEIFNFYEKLSLEFLDYELPQILLLHANDLNADYLPKLLKMMEKKGYSFISLEKALEDKAYQLPEVTSRRGLSWIQRWMLAAGQNPKSQPEVNEKVMEMFRNMR